MNLNQVCFISKYCFLVVFLLVVNLYPTDKVMAYACPNYKFERNIEKNTYDPDVRVIQEILNLDQRTVVAYSGPGSKGKETTMLGKATRESLKRFQALFIEYIGVADGKFNEKTRLVMNNVCQGPFFTGGGKSVYDLSANASGDVIPPVVGVASQETAQVDTPFRAYLGASEAIKTPSLTSFMVEGAVISDIRKTSSTTFNYLVTPNPNNFAFISIQIEADTIEDLAGNKNSKASNEWKIKVLPGTGTVNPTTTLPIIDFPIIDLPTIGTSTTDCSSVASVSVDDYTNPCYGKVPTTFPQTSDTSSGGGGMDLGQIMQFVTGFLKGFTGLGSGTGGSSLSGGGIGTLPGYCVCTPDTIPPGTLTGQPTILLTPKGGTSPGGRYLMTLNPGAGNYTGFTSPFPGGVCGQRIQITNSRRICVNPLSDNTGGVVVGALPPKPSFNWGF